VSSMQSVDVVVENGTIYTAKNEYVASMAGLIDLFEAGTISRDTVVVLLTGSGMKGCLCHCEGLRENSNKPSNNRRTEKCSGKRARTGLDRLKTSSLAERTYLSRRFPSLRVNVKSKCKVASGITK